jgi:hypothetical protein
MRGAGGLTQVRQAGFLNIISAIKVPRVHLGPSLACKPCAPSGRSAELVLCGHRLAALAKRLFFSGWDLLVLDDLALEAVVVMASSREILLNQSVVSQHSST